MAEYVKETGFESVFNVGEYWADLKCSPPLVPITLYLHVTLGSPYNVLHGGGAWCRLYAIVPQHGL